MRATEHDRLDRKTAAKEKKSNAFWSVEFVRSETGGIDQGKIGIDFAERLHHVAVQQYAAFAAYSRNFAHRLNYTGLVVGGHDRNESGLGPDRISKLIDVDDSIARNIQPGYFETFVLFQMFDRVQAQRDAPLCSK